MYIPPGAFGGTTPERRAAQLMNAMITYVSAWIVIAQLENVAPRSSLEGEDGGFDGERETTASWIRTNFYSIIWRRIP